MAQVERYSVDEVCRALIESNGFVSVTAKKLGCTQQTVRNYLKRYKLCRDAVKDAREQMKDFTENMLFNLIQDGNVAAIIFYLKTQARDRGYDRDGIADPSGRALLIQRVEIMLPPGEMIDDQRLLPAD